MKLTSKDILILVVFTLLSFPLTFVAVLFLTGNARLEFGPKLELERTKELAVMSNSARRDSLAASHSQTFQSLLSQRTELLSEQQRLGEQESHITILEAELEEARLEIQQQRKAIEGLVSNSRDLDTKRLRQLAKVYSAMRAAEAAQILSTLDDQQVADILINMGDDRQKAKILSTLPADKATRVSRGILK